MVLNMAFPSALSTGVMTFAAGNDPDPRSQRHAGLLRFQLLYSRYCQLSICANARNFSPTADYSEDADLSDNKFIANDPEGMFERSNGLVRTFPNLPILITENGVEDADDHMRPRYLAQHIHQMWRAVNFNWPVKGYFHWTLVDNFEWERGWTQRFGLWALDVENTETDQTPICGSVCGDLQGEWAFLRDGAEVLP